MRVKALRNITDKKTGKKHDAGDEFTVSKERFAEMNATPLGKVVEECLKSNRDKN